MRYNKNYLAAAISAATLLCSQTVLSDEDFFIEEVIVTATKRAESVQDIPLAVTAIDADSLSQRSINSIETLATSVPGLHVSQAGSNTRITVRGIGSEQNSVTGDPGVAFHIDGVYQSRSSAGSALLYDLERIEVLRGPQGTLYGRNATGGSINVISKRPQEELAGNLELQVGNYNQQVVSGVFNAPLIEDELLIRISGQQETRDGFYQNQTPGAEDLDDVDSLNLRTQLLYFPSDDLEVLLALNYATEKGAGDGGRVVGSYPVNTSPINLITSGYASTPFPFGPGLASSAAASDNPDGDWDIKTNAENNRDNERKGASLTVDWDLGAVALKSITAWQDNTVNSVRDLDFTDAEVMNEFRFEDSRQYSQELQLSSNTDSPWQWVAGVYWLSEETQVSNWLFDDGSGLSSLIYTPVYLPAPATAPFLNGQSLFSTVDSGEGFDAIYGYEGKVFSDSLGAFGQASYSVTEDLTLTAGLRWSEDRKKANLRFKDLGNSLVPGKGESSFTKKDSWDAITWKLGADWFVSSDSMVYASVSTGFKSGGFLQDPDSLAYDEEHILAWELGSKNKFWGGRLQANISAFYYEYEDMQLSTVLDAQIVTTNAGEADILGVELELLARPVEALILSVALASTRAKFLDYFADDPLVAGVVEEDLSGNELARSPDWTFNLNAAYTVDVPYGSLTASANMFWSDEVYFSAFNRKDDPAGSQNNYRTTDLRLQFDSVDGSWQVSLAAKNLEDERVASNAREAISLGGPDTYIQWQAPRTYSLSVGYNF